MDILKSIFKKKDKREIVVRLLAEGSITQKEAVILLDNKITINIQKAEMSSGAKIVYGDDNEMSRF